MRLHLTAIFTLILIATTCLSAVAQPVYKVHSSKSGNFKLSGTSSLHKWDMNAKTFSSNAQFG